MNSREWMGFPTTLCGELQRPSLVRCAECIYAGWCICFPFVSIALFIVGYRLWGSWIFPALFASVFIAPIVRFLILPPAPLTHCAVGDPLSPVSWPFVVMLWLPTQIGFILWALYIAISDAGTAGVLGLMVAAGLLGSSTGAAIAHDLLHSHDRLDRALAEMLMYLTSYPQFPVVHLRHHHAQLGTVDDRGTAHRGKNIYVFSARAIVGSFADGWRAVAADTTCGNTEREQERGRIVRYASVLGIMYLALLVFAGWAGVVFMLGQSLVGIFVVEGLNFVQHYGLGHDAKSHPPGSTPADLAWNVRYSRSNWLMARLGRHAEHHLESGCGRHLPPWVLTDIPQLPCGYWTMFVIALLPPLWRKIMDPRVDRILSRRVVQQEPQR